ncbi:glycosyltransferase family A protein [Pseudomonas sp. FSL R10-2398]|uniref:glycosyltransferase family 2 protein n=1 Tax=Pseudomonas sp. FSL R10-2398 TaxID=2662201 RepID=UPI001297C588|nr:glycosyltransferase family A protein [Pseudomonas sp. FSL R10-2398]MQT55446.1 glycosyltransferase [Pseudomonas sp. FSL R10-2398]
MLTVVTATYNRAYTLPRLFDSLLQQTRMDFEWVVVDDGSTDETESRRLQELSATRLLN